MLRRERRKRLKAKLEVTDVPTIEEIQARQDAEDPRTEVAEANPASELTAL